MSLTHSSFLQAPLTAILDFYSKIIVPKLTQKNKVTAISAAIALSIVYIIRDRVLKPPRKLRHIPYHTYFNVLTSIIKNESYWDRSYRHTLPQIDSPESNGIYLRPGRLGWEVHIANPEAAKKVLFKQDLFPKADLSTGKEDTLSGKFVAGPNLAITNGAKWKSQRMIANPAFRRSMPVKLFGNLTIELFEIIESTDGTVNFSDLIERWTLEAIGKAGFGFDFNALREKDNEWVKTYEIVSRGMEKPLYFIFPMLDQKSLRWLIPERQAMHNEMDRLLKMLDGIIVQKKEMIKQGNTQNDNLEENEKDLLSLMIESELRGEGVITEEELKSNLCVFFIAGHDTTSNALQFAIYHLAKNPEIQQRAREEAIAILGDKSENVLPTVEQTKQMTYINQIIKETLRIHGPAVQVSPRVAEEDTILSGTLVPKGSIVIVDIFNIQHSDKVWKNGDTFDPERFSENNKSVQSTGEGVAWMPFGSGSRVCIGQNFSLNEQRVLLSMLLRKFTWTLPENSMHKEKLIMRGIGVIGPNHLDIKFTKRY